MKRNNKREEKKRVMREEIIQKVEVLFENKQYFQMSVEEICSFVGISVGMFYRLFSSRNTIFEYVFKDTLYSKLEDMENKIESLALSEQLKLYYITIVDSLCSMGWENLFSYYNAQDEPGKATWDGKIVEMSINIIQSAVEKDPSIQLSRTPEEITLDVFRVTKGLCRVWAAQEPDRDPVEMIGGILNRIIDDLL